MAAYNTSEAVKKGNYEEAFQHALTPVLTGSVSKGVNLGLKASERAVVTEGTNPQYLGEFTEGSYISPKTSYKSIFMEEPVMSSSKGLTEAEKLGIPKSLRSDARALEDPYYWGYEQ